METQLENMQNILKDDLQKREMQVKTIKCHFTLVSWQKILNRCTMY